MNKDQFVKTVNREIPPANSQAPFFIDGELVSIVVNENPKDGHILGESFINSFGHRAYCVQLFDGSEINRIENLIYKHP